jgi:D-glycero-alpha-D-manno-heptose-7-phosphate kinase
MHKKVRSRAPLRLGLAGGGTDVSPYSDEYGGAVLNATINMFSYCTISLNTDNKVFFNAQDLDISFESDPKLIELDGDLILHKAIYNKVMTRFNNSEFLPINVLTHCDAPVGSGLGSSSTVVVSILKAYQELLNLPLGEYDLAHLAYDIERIDCRFSGGKQDQYCASFGGLNFMEFYGDDRVIVNPLRVKSTILAELEASTLLFFTGVSRDSSNIIDDQVNALENDKCLQGLHKVKDTAFSMKEAILKGDMVKFFSLQKEAWNAKKQTSKLISNHQIEKISSAVLLKGALALKVSGAGGGGFMMIYCNPDIKRDITRTLEQFNGKVYNLNFSQEGAKSWVVN